MEYEKNLKILEEGLQKERESDCSKQKQREYRELIKDQIRIKEQQRKFEGQNSNKKLNETRLQEQQRQERVNQILASKLKELQISRVPDNLIKDVERRIKRVP